MELLPAARSANAPGPRAMKDIVGYRFYPTDVEILDYYLWHKRQGNEGTVSQAISEINLCQNDPWELPTRSRILSENAPWFFIYQLERCANGRSFKRTTRSGYWKATGVDRQVIRLGGGGGNGVAIGAKKTLVFYRGRQRSSAERTKWVIHEYHPFSDASSMEGDYVIAKLKINNELKDPNLKTGAAATADLNISEIDIDSLGWREIYQLCRPLPLHQSQFRTASELELSDKEFVNGLTSVDPARAAELFSHAFEFTFEAKSTAETNYGEIGGPS